MERFICYDKGHRQECEAFPDPDGDYVRHEAHLAAVRELEAENATLRAKVARLEAPVTDADFDEHLHPGENKPMALLNRIIANRAKEPA
jgi:hypothetical protein